MEQSYGPTHATDIGERLKALDKEIAERNEIVAKMKDNLIKNLRATIEAQSEKIADLTARLSIYEDGDLQDD